MEIPHIETRWDIVGKRYKSSINLMPSPRILGKVSQEKKEFKKCYETYFSQAYLSLIESYGWKTFTILYQDSEGLVRMQELLETPTQSDIKIVLKKLNFQNNEENK